MKTDAQRIHALKSLVGVLTSALEIVKQTHYSDQTRTDAPPVPGFTPARTKEVVETALICANSVDSI